MPLEIVALRHGQCTGNAASKEPPELFPIEVRKQRSRDWPLTALGRRESRLAGDWVKKNIAESFDAYIHSGFVRTSETGEELGFDGAQWITEPLLRERDWGGVENLHYTERKKVFERIGRPFVEDSPEWRPPGGESMTSIMARMETFLGIASKRFAGKRILVVCHGGTIQALRLLQLKPHPSEYAAFVGGSNYIRNAHVFHYYGKIGSSAFPSYSFERSAFLENNTWIDSIKKTS